MSDEEKASDTYFQQMLSSNNLPPETTKGQYMWWALKRAIKSLAWVVLFFGGFTLVILWNFAPDLFFEIVGAPFVILGIALPFLMIAGFIYIGYLVVRWLKKQGDD